MIQNLHTGEQLKITLHPPHNLFTQLLYYSLVVYLKPWVQLLSPNTPMLFQVYSMIWYSCFDVSNHNEDKAQGNRRNACRWFFNPILQKHNCFTIGKPFTCLQTAILVHITSCNHALTSVTYWFAIALNNLRDTCSSTAAGRHRKYCTAESPTYIILKHKNLEDLNGIPFDYQARLFTSFLASLEKNTRQLLPYTS